MSIVRIICQMIMTQIMTKITEWVITKKIIMTLITITMNLKNEKCPTILAQIGI